MVKLLKALGLLCFVGLLAACATPRIQQSVRTAVGPLPVCDASSARAPTEGKNKILQVPRIKEASDKRRCSIEQMTIAVVDNGAFRKVYGDNDGYPTTVDYITTDEAINPVLKYLARRARAYKDSLEKAAGKPVADNGTHYKMKPLKILLYAHGGMVAHEGALASAESLAPMMMRDGYTPLFLVWNSDFPPTYLTGACCVRKGGAAILAPAYFLSSRIVSDLLGGISEMPETFANQLIRWDRSVRKKENTEYYLNTLRQYQSCRILAQRSLTAWSAEECIQKRVVFPFVVENFEDQGKPDIANGFDSLGITKGGIKFDHVLNDQIYHFGKKEILYGSFFPVRTTLSALGPEVGMRAWDNMVRRTRLAFEPEYAVVTHRDMISSRAQSSTKAPKATKDTVAPSQSGFWFFFKHLDDELKDGGIEVDGRIVPVELHYYGHSMGALVGNELLWRFPEIPWKKVVYMGGATSIREFRMMALPVLKRKKIKFHNLSLHPIAESRELNLNGIPPQGSLLEWVDELFAGPRSIDERTIGKWNNIERVLPALVGNDRDFLMNFKVFPKQASLTEKSQLGDGLRRTEAERLGNVYFDKYCDKFPTLDKKGLDPEVTAKGEPVQKNQRCYPISHGGFNHYSFWRKAYLTSLMAED